jgi:hypothetical protein
MTMLYALLVYTDQSSWWDLSEEEAAERRAEAMPRWIAAFAELRRADPALASVELDDATTAKVVRIREGRRVVTDGPYAETKELVGGAFLVELPDLDEAIRLAALVPASEYGSIEIRPVVRR